MSLAGTADWRGGVRQVGDVSPVCCSCMERGKARVDTAVHDFGGGRQGACQAAEPQGSEYRRDTRRRTGA